MLNGKKSPKKRSIPPEAHSAAPTTENAAGKRSTATIFPPTVLTKPFSRRSNRIFAALIPLIDESDVSGILGGEENVPDSLWERERATVCALTGEENKRKSLKRNV
jgi:hypothetical protein